MYLPGMYLGRYVVPTNFPNTNKEKKREKERKRKEKEIHAGFVGIGGRTDHSINRNQGTYLM